MKLSEFLNKFGADETSIINYAGIQAIEAVKRNGYALRYVDVRIFEIESLTNAETQGGK